MPRRTLAEREPLGAGALGRAFAESQADAAPGRATQRTVRHDGTGPCPSHWARQPGDRESRGPGSFSMVHDQPPAGEVCWRLKVKAELGNRLMNMHEMTQGQVFKK